MKTLLFAILIISVTALSCGSSGTDVKEETPKDSQMVAEHVDPSTKFPGGAVQTDTLKADPSFVQNAVESGEELAGLADIAVKKSGNAAVKKIAQAIANDQKSWLTGLKLLNKKLTNAPNYTDHSREELEKLSGNAFDKQWVEKMDGKYTALISRYETEKETTKDRSVKKLVDEALPVMKTHQQELEACRHKL
jgi:predicted outer membrane protein